MSLPSTARVVIIRGGVIGTSALYHLARAGWSDRVLLEKTELTAGSTWHAAGNCPNFAPDYGVMKMQSHGLALYRGLADEVDHPINCRVTGAVRLAHTEARMMEFERLRDRAAQMGLRMDICTPDELQGHMPFMETHDLAGGLWDPLDGDIDPGQVTQALARGARAAGAPIARYTPATGVSRRNGEWIVHTDTGDIRCAAVVNAAGYCAARVGAWFVPRGGRPVPMAVMSHQHFVTAPIPGIRARSEAQGRKLPMLRDVDSSCSLRQETNALNLGPYERDRRLGRAPGRDMTEYFSFQLYPDDLDRLEGYIMDAMARVPDAFEAHDVAFGIARGGGAGKALSEWIMHGQPEWDMWGCDPRRFTGRADAADCAAKAMEVYGHEYAMHFPHHERPAALNRTLSADYDLFESGPDRFVRLDEPQDFPGKAAIALAMLDDTVPSGAPVQVAVHGRMHEASVQPGTCLWDADNSRLRAPAERTLAHDPAS